MAVTVRHHRDFSPTARVQSDINNSVVTVTLDVVAGFPTAFPWLATIDRGTTTPEAVTVTDGTGTTLTITRNANGLGAFSHTANATFEHTGNAIDLEEANQHINATSDVHGVDGALVGTTDPQTLSNKTFNGVAFNATGGVPGVNILANAHTDIGWEVRDHTAADVVVAKVDGAGKLTAKDAALVGVTATTLATTGNVAAGGNATVAGTAAVTGALTAGSAQVNGGLGVTGDAGVTGDLNVNGATTAHGNVSALSTMTVHSSVTLNSDTGSTTIKGATTIDDVLSVTGAATVTGVLSGLSDVKSHGSVVPLGTLARVVGSANGNAVGTTEILDSGIPILTLTALGSRRVEAVVSGRGLQNGVDGSRYVINIRDGGANNPTKDSPLYGSHNTVKVITTLEESYFMLVTDMPTAGVHKLGVFVQQVAGSGTAVPSGACEFMVRDVGTV